MEPQNPKSQASKFGKIAEDFAIKLLKDKSYKILDRNFHSRFGEIDIIAIDKDTLVFVEVKARWSQKYGLPEESVTYFKLRKIKRTAEYYSFLHSDLPQKLRIDVVALEFVDGQISSSKVIQLDQ